MSTDLHAQLLAAVEARRQLALAATPGPWDHIDHGEGGTFMGCGQVVTLAEDVMFGDIAAPSGDCYPRSGYSPFEDMAFIAANDPATVIRHCERDLKVLERHGPRKSQWHLVSGQEYEVCCRTCAEVDHDVPAPWPCDEIRDLADAYAAPDEGSVA